MNVYDCHNPEGEFSGIEVERKHLSHRRICSIISNMPNVKIIRTPPFLSDLIGLELFCEFELEGVEFIVFEFGESDRYTITTRGANVTGGEQLKAIRDYLMLYK